MQKLKSSLASALLNKLDTYNAEHGLDALAVSDMLETPPDPAMGDFALPCFKLSRVLRRSPQQIAADLAE